ncbi:hypothetical protein [Methanobrevibacter millerae]|uniref:Uncharacterized protein n=1 Tax=Methanobrevibacter millerae TaxID=230361 RepID=A0A1G5WGE5_9EURY|nr:hypothetical protein [Methanobrevibacter millerae]SDA57130.1 hypothetical protein SAMN02910315_01390 [Methanobrevibacter millerae]
MLIEQFIFRLSQNIDISQKFKREDLTEFCNDNEIDSYLKLLKDYELLHEENNEFYFDDEVINQLNAQMTDNENDDAINNESLDTIDNASETNTETIKEEIMSENDNLDDSQEVLVKHVENKTLDDYNKKSDLKAKLSNDTSEPKYWIHKTEFSILEAIHELNQIGSEKKKSKIIKEINPGDYILLIVNNRGHLDFFGLTKVDEILNIEKHDKSDFYTHYQSDVQLKLKSIRYFSNPVIGNEMGDELSFIEKNKTISAYLRTDYKEISKEDFKTIIRKIHYIKSFPAYFDIVDLNLKEFIMNSILYLYNNLKNKQKSELIEIKVFLRKLTDFVNSLGVKVSYDYIVEFYSWNAIELEFTHVPYRDPDKAIPLYDTRGKKKEYAYIDLK